MQPSRYHRQEMLPGVGPEGQAALRAAHAAIVGIGALGCAVADHLARAGVGRLTLIDRDLVERTNLQRQMLFDERDAAEAAPKAEAARRRLSAINSSVEVVAQIADLTSRNAERLILSDGPPGVIIDGTDNFETRYLLNDFSVKHGIPYVYGGVVATRGMQMTIRPGATACLRCVFEQPPPPGSQPTCDTAGVLGPAVAIVGACEASDALRILLGHGHAIPPTLLEFDLWSGRRRRIDLSRARRDDCPCCGKRDFEFLARGSGSAGAALCGQRAVQVQPPEPAGRLDLDAVARRLEPHGPVRSHPHMLRCSLTSEEAEGGGQLELTIFRDGRAIVRGTTLPDRARSVYAKYIGV
ncbi:MAG TPA: ThiF family adenylyltransferase [Phycisphaerales bacterium]|nr:ThiF family adenylyltransferase [Phycisphaerales bacterium]